MFRIIRIGLLLVSCFTENEQERGMGRRGWKIAIIIKYTF